MSPSAFASISVLLLTMGLWSGSVQLFLSTNPGLFLFWFPLDFSNVRSFVFNWNVPWGTPGCLEGAAPASPPAQSPDAHSAAAPTAPQHLPLTWSQARAAELPLAPLGHRSSGLSHLASPPRDCRLGDRLIYIYMYPFIDIHVYKKHLLWQDANLDWWHSAKKLPNKPVLETNPGVKGKCR